MTKELELLDDAKPAQPSRAIVASATPADLVRYAMESGADLDRLEKLMGMQIAWEQRQAEKAYNEAFAAFKAEAVVIIKNRAVKDGPLKNKKYAELFAVVNAITPALSKHGLSASWRLTRDEKDWMEVTCTLKHSGGHAESVSMGGPPDAGGAKNAIQARGSTKTYLERYTLKAICGVAEQDEDDDGAGDGDKSADDMLTEFRNASMNGTKALRACYEKRQPDDEWWGKNSKALKEAAKRADEEGQK